MVRSKRSFIEVESYSDAPSQPSPIYRHTDFTSSNTGLSISRSYYTVSAPSPQTSVNALPETTEEYPDFLGPDHFSDLDPEFDPDVVDPAVGQRHRKHTMAGDNPMLVWIHERDTFVQEFLRLEARNSSTGCADCSATALYRCTNCFDQRLFCKTCIQSRHAALPFHQVEVNLRFFERRSLRSLGFRVQLGHPLGEACPHPASAFNDEFVVITLNGIVTVSMDFCNCTKALTRTVQLLRACLFPATTIEPRTAATFEVLRLFQLLSFGSKLSGQDFYLSLSRLSNNLGEYVPDRYHAFMRIVREWRNIRLLKRSGRGHDPSGVAGTSEGECAVYCPACPHPGKNLPSDWEHVDERKRWIYSLFVAIDANFRLKRLSSSDDIRDPSLNDGCAYFVSEKTYKDFINACQDSAEEISTCNNYDAVKLASIRGANGTTASGVGTIECSRHDMKRPLSVGDLQKGERYINMDYLYFSSLRHHSPMMVVVSYDIACQWSRHLTSRGKSYPEHVIGPRYFHLNTRFLVPKFHLYAHRDECQVNYSFNLAPKVGRTDGESPERGWAAMNPVASSTKEMGPGSRRDTLDDHFGDYNWRKVVSLPSTFLRRVKEAVSMRAEHVSSFLTFSNSLPPATVQVFCKLIWDWEAGKSQDNPYEAKLEAISQVVIRRQLADEDAIAVARDENLAVHESVSPSDLVVQGIELQNQQFRLQMDVCALSANATEIQRTRIQERRNRLRRRIIAWRGIQELYIPGITFFTTREEQATGKALEAEDLKIYLPSDVISLLRSDLKLAEYEWCLRYGQGFDLLGDLRRNLLVLSTMYQSKDRFIRGQQHNTRSVTLIKNVQARINHIRDSYHLCRAALVVLGKRLGKSGWEQELKPLADADIRSLKEGEDATSSEGRRTLSWIWMTQRGSEANMTEGMSEALRIEWCKSRARAQRWQEECILLSEEMRRVIEFHAWQAGVWEVRASKADTEGVQAYAWRQADIRRSLILQCQTAWKDTKGYLEMGDGAAKAGDQLVEVYLGPINST